VIEGLGSAALKCESNVSFWSSGILRRSHTSTLRGMEQIKCSSLQQGENTIRATAVAGLNIPLKIDS
jgi:hypothetical protein